MCHVAQATSEYLCGQLLAVTIDLADSIVTVCRLVGHGARLDYIIAAGVALLLSDLGTLLEQEFDLLLKTVGVSPDLSQLLALEILQQFEGSNTVVIGAVVLTLETNLHLSLIHIYDLREFSFCILLVYSCCIFLTQCGHWSFQS